MSLKDIKAAISISRSAKFFLCTFLFFFIFQNNAFAATLGQSKSFLVDKNYDLSGRSTVSAFLAYESKDAYFYFEKDYYDNLSAAEKADVTDQIKNLGQEFDKTIYPVTRETFGEEWNPGIDGEDKLFILFSELPSNVGGYFNPNDEYSKDNVTGGRSNESEMIYLNPDFLKSGKVEGFLSHEFQHMIYWNQKTRIEGVVDDVWMNEGRSELSSAILEDSLGKDFQSQTLAVRKKDFLANYYDSIVDWNNKNYDYSSVSIFMQYLKDHFGIGIFKDMNLTKKTGINNLDYVLKSDDKIGLNEVFTNWTIANYINDENFDLRYGYENKNLKTDFNISPGLINDKNNDGIMNVTGELKNWSGNYYKLDLSTRKNDGLYVEIGFNGDDLGKFSVPFVVNYKNGSKEVDFVDLNVDQDGSKSMSFKNGAVDSIVFIPSSQRSEEAAENNQVKSYSFSLDIKLLSIKDMTRPDGTLIRAAGGEKVYLIDQGQKRWITDLATFVSKGYDWMEASPVVISNNSLVKGSGPKIYLIDNNQKRWIKDEQTFVSYGFDWNKIIKISDIDLAKYADGVSLSKSAFADGALIKDSDPKVYLIQSGKKRWITSANAFKKNNFKWSSVIETSKEIVSSYVDGPNID
jgi:hypothetical protein